MKLHIKKISIEEFESDIYSKLEKLFPDAEMRRVESIRKTCESGNENLYKVNLDDKTIGFFSLEKLENYPYYLDYFVIYEEYQDRGFGTLVMQIMLSKIVSGEDVFGEIEKVEESNSQSIRRWNFYKKVGFKLTNLEYDLFTMIYNPIVFSPKKYSNEAINTILFSYYELNSGKEAVEKNCKIISGGA